MGFKVERDEGLISSLNQLSVADNQPSVNNNPLVHLTDCSPLQPHLEISHASSVESVSVDISTLIQSASDDTLHAVSSGFRTHPSLVLIIEMKT